MAFGRVCIMGDAAFVARPHAAAGTAKAAEDAWQLGKAFTESESGVVAALKSWEERQLACGRQLVNRAREIGNRLQFSNSWPVGEPFPFGLYKPGDSAIEASEVTDSEGTKQRQAAVAAPLGSPRVDQSDASGDDASCRQGSRGAKRPLGAHHDT
jgi:hypothetical protein